jgi:large subunit ribosomal protein L35
MAKLKTIKAVAKRVRVTKTGKVMKKKAGRDHYNSRETGKVTRNKRKPTVLSESHAKNVKRFINA